MKTVLIKVHAGGGWEGHVVYTVTHPDNSELSHCSSNMEEAFNFCKNHGLQMDENFVELVKKHLVFEHKMGLVIPPEHIEEYQPITSASKFLKNHFSKYY